MDSNSRVCEGSSCFCHANATLPYQEWGEVIRAGGKGQDLPKLRAASCMGRGEKCSPPSQLLVPSLLLLRGPLHRLLDLLLLQAGSRSHWDLPGHGDHGALGREDHDGRHILHGPNFVADDLLGAVAGGASAVAGALGVVAASVSTGAHGSVGVVNPREERPLSVSVRRAECLPPSALAFPWFWSLLGLVRICPSHCPSSELCSHSAEPSHTISTPP